MVVESPRQIAAYTPDFPGTQLNYWSLEYVLPEVGNLSIATTVDLSSYEIGQTLPLSSLLNKDPGTAQYEYHVYYTDAEMSRARVGLS